MATKNIREAAVSSFPFWASKDDAANMEFIRNKMPRPVDVGPTDRIANNHVISFALLRAANKMRAENGKKTVKKKTAGTKRPGKKSARK
jgi:hypothetical protein